MFVCETNKDVCLVVKDDNVHLIVLNFQCCSGICFACCANFVTFGIALN